MKLLAKVEYACKAVLELALRYNEKGPIQLNKISQTQDIPQKFLIQLLLRLKNANIVDTSRGALGGYYLTRPPAQITVADVFKAVDSNILERTKKPKDRGSLDANKVIFGIWDDINNYTAKKLQDLTFEDLINKINKKQLTYYI